jgi:hypothetical protein
MSKSSPDEPRRYSVSLYLYPADVAVMANTGQSVQMYANRVVMAALGIDREQQRYEEGAKS